MQNGIYKSENATYFIKDKKILMKLKGDFYKTNENFMQGRFQAPLSEGMDRNFDKAYSQAKNW